MCKRLNNKGYMLVEIILAFVIAMGVAYFMFDLIIKLKNNNDDLLVKTLVYTDQAIIYNTIMDDVYKNGLESFSCDKIKIEDNKFVYDGEVISIVSDYANIEFDSSNTNYCDDTSDEVKINIPISVKQLPDDNFNVKISYDVAMIPVCNLSVDASTITISATISEQGSGISYYGWDSQMIDGNGSMTTVIDAVGTYIYYVVDKTGNVGTCSVDISKYVLSNTNQISCSSSNYNNKSSACNNGYVYSYNTCDRTPSSYTVEKAECYQTELYDGMNSNYIWRKKGTLTEYGVSSCTIQVSDGSDCTFQDNFDGTIMISNCKIESYNYSGSIVCNKYICENENHTRIGTTNYCYKIN